MIYKLSLGLNDLSIDDNNNEILMEKEKELCLKETLIYNNFELTFLIKGHLVLDDILLSMIINLLDFGETDLKLDRQFVKIKIQKKYIEKYLLLNSGIKKLF